MILDIAMPGMDGLQLARRVREQPWGSAILLIAASGWSQAEHNDQSLISGFDHHLVKPVEAAVLTNGAAPRDLICSLGSYDHQRRWLIVIAACLSSPFASRGEPWWDATIAITRNDSRKRTKRANIWRATGIPPAVADLAADALASSERAVCCGLRRCGGRGRHHQLCSISGDASFTPANPSCRSHRRFRRHPRRQFHRGSDRDAMCDRDRAESHRCRHPRRTAPRRSFRHARATGGTSTTCSATWDCSKRATTPSTLHAYDASVGALVPACDARTATLVVSAQPGATATAPVVEFYNATLDHYFITQLLRKATRRRRPSWKRTGESFRMYLPGQLDLRGPALARLLAAMPSAGLTCISSPRIAESAAPWRTARSATRGS